MLEWLIKASKCQLMTSSRLRQLTEPAVLVPEVAKQHDECVRAIAFRVVVSARDSFWLDEVTRELVGCFDEGLSKPEREARLPQALRTFAADTTASDRSLALSSRDLLPKETHTLAADKENEREVQGTYKSLTVTVDV